MRFFLIGVAAPLAVYLLMCLLHVALQRWQRSGATMDAAMADSGPAGATTAGDASAPPVVVAPTGARPSPAGP